MLVQSCKSAPKSARLRQDELRSRVRISDFVTEKTTHDSIFTRYVKNDLTNQRRLQSSFVIENAKATGTLKFNTDLLKPENIKALLEYGCFYTGMGSARKMGYGRATVTSFTQTA